MFDYDYEYNYYFYIFQGLEADVEQSRWLNPNNP